MEICVFLYLVFSIFYCLIKKIEFIYEDRLITLFFDVLLRACVKVKGYRVKTKSYQANILKGERQLDR